VRLPWVGALFGPYREPRARSAGLISVNGTKLYVTRGFGTGPIRIGCPREITLVTLRRGGKSTCSGVHGAKHDTAR
jgi:predicted MPP superfamily phosphohydrolase